MALFIRASSNKSFLTFINKYHNKLSINLFKQNRLPVITRQLFLTDNGFHNTRDFGTLTADYNQKNNAENHQNKTKDFGESDIEPLGPFDSFLLQRRWEAKKSVIVQVESAKSYEDLYSYCQKFGPISYIRHYSVVDDNNFFLIEFNDVSSFQSLMEEATHINSNEIVQTHSQMLWFRDVLLHKHKQNSLLGSGKNIKIPPLSSDTQNPNKPVTSEFIKSLISTNETVSEQMKQIYEKIKLQDIDVRLRFILANQIETSLSGLFPTLTVLPFGSSVNGFGKCDSDLDLSINVQTKPELPTSRLVFHVKSGTSEDRVPMKRLLESISGLMRTAFPGVTKVTNILRARVPIIKYEHLYTGIECDLSIANLAAVYMSELLYLFGEYDKKVRPLVYTIRLWALFINLTNSKAPGPWISNFSLTLLVLFYLQQKGILPSINYLQSRARASDSRIADGTVNCTFLRDLNKWPPSKCPNITLEELLHDFFRYYSEFDFTTQAVSLRHGKSTNKAISNQNPMYICNPLEPSLNVSKNVSINEMTSFSIAIQNAALLMNEGERFYRRGLIDIFIGKTSLEKRYFKRKNEDHKIARIFKLLYPGEQTESSNINNATYVGNTKNTSDQNNKRNGKSNLNKINSSSSRNSNSRDNYNNNSDVNVKNLGQHKEPR